jgi:hypothetical protein
MATSIKLKINALLEDDSFPSNHPYVPPIPRASLKAIAQAKCRET